MGTREELARVLEQRPVQLSPQDVVRLTACLNAVGTSLTDRTGSSRSSPRRRTRGALTPRGHQRR